MHLPRTTIDHDRRRTHSEILAGFHFPLKHLNLICVVGWFTWCAWYINFGSTQPPPPICMLEGIIIIMSIATCIFTAFCTIFRSHSFLFILWAYFHELESRRRRRRRLLNETKRRDEMRLFAGLYYFNHNEMFILLRECEMFCIWIWMYIGGWITTAWAEINDNVERKKSAERKREAAQQQQQHKKKHKRQWLEIA